MISFDTSVTEKIAREGYSEEFGARNIRRYIQDNIESVLSRWILDDTLIKNKEYVLAVDDGGQLIVT